MMTKPDKNIQNILLSSKLLWPIRLKNCHLPRPGATKWLVQHQTSRPNKFEYLHKTLEAYS